MASVEMASSKGVNIPKGRCNKRRRSFTEALKEKYCTEENWDTEGFSIKIVVHGKKPRNKDGGAELGFLTNVCLDRGSISHAGIPDGGLISLCPNVVDLDLSNNLIESWDEILPIISELHHLKFVNLARNQFKDTQILRHWKQELPSIENLVLNNTGVCWDDVIKLAQFMPHLKELHVCKNGYSKLSDQGLGALRNLECLRLNENRITRWSEVWKMRTLPLLSTLILSGNPLLEIFYETPENSNESDTTVPDNGHRSGNFLDNENSNGRTISESSVNSLENEIRDIELNFDSADDEDTIENGDISGTSFDDIDDSTVAEQCNSFVENVMLKVIGRMLDGSPGTMDLETQGQSVPAGSGSDATGSNDSSPRESTENKTHRQNSCGLSNGETVKSNVPFLELRVLCVSETLLSKWSDLEALAKFPKLRQLRVKDVSLLCHVPMEERRKLFLASLPKITSLNGSDVTESERDKSERHFLRHFAKLRHKPERYNDLVDKHGKLKPLKEVDISFGYQEWVRIGIVYKGIKLYEEDIYVVDPIGKLRQFVSKKLFLSIGSFRMLHFPCGEGHKGINPELDELRLDSLPMSRYNFMDGDEIHIDHLEAGPEKKFKISTSTKVTPRSPVL